jgi:hypothetical protein
VARGGPPLSGARSSLGRAAVDAKAAHGMSGLLRYGRAARAYLVLTVALGTATALLVVTQAWVLATIVGGAFSDGEDLAELRAPVFVLLVVVLLRALVVWYAEVAANRSSARVKSQLRAARVERLATLGPPGLSGRRTGDLAVPATRGTILLEDQVVRRRRLLADAEEHPTVPIDAVPARLHPEFDGARHGVQGRRLTGEHVAAIDGESLSGHAVFEGQPGGLRRKLTAGGREVTIEVQEEHGLTGLRLCRLLARHPGPARRRPATRR